MTAAAGGNGRAHAITFESEGVRIRITADRTEVSERFAEVLPPDATAIEVDEVDESFGLVADDAGTYTFTRDNSPVSSDLDLEFGLMMLQIQIRIFVGLNAPNRIFVHAGVVALNDRALVFPGRSFSGKTTLVAEFLRAGATYLSDEFAVFDEEALVHPYPSRLSIREPDEQRRAVRPVELGGVLATSALPVGAVVVTSFRSGAQWVPQPITRGRAALALLDNTVAAVERPDEALSVFRKVTSGPILLASDRGEAAAVVADLLSRLG